MGTTSQKQIEANRRNARRSTGPRTEEGKRRSRQNGLRHGLAAEVVVPEEDRGAYEAAMARWEREAGPDNVVEEQLIRRAAVASVRLERIEREHEGTREQSARAAVGRWERRRRASATRAGARLTIDPAGVVEELEASAFGCDWLSRQWQNLAAPLRLGRPWDGRALDRAQLLLGLPEGTPGPGGEPIVRLFWILAGAAGPGQVEAIGRVGVEASLPSEPDAARAALLRLIARQVDRLAALRDDAWEAVDGPEREAIARLALAADTSREGQLRHRYEVASDRSCLAAIRTFLSLRDRRRRELLALAREASHMGETPRAPVGGGWWREPDSDPAPPGFVRGGNAPFPPAPSAPPAAVPTRPVTPAESGLPGGLHPSPETPHPGVPGSPSCPGGGSFIPDSGHSGSRNETGSEFVSGVEVFRNPESPESGIPPIRADVPLGVAGQGASPQHLAARPVGPTALKPGRSGEPASDSKPDLPAGQGGEIVSDGRERRGVVRPVPARSEPISARNPEAIKGLMLIFGCDTPPDRVADVIRKGEGSSGPGRVASGLTAGSGGG